ncbi:mRNA decay activator protein zfp36 [Modicella reniformis]|uniref:mRNA decay activator protein zfp36 n=1 Tax=Modicella reniformis TaxID=1440133 RepID=A0A9P6MK73_9FUNG|nr:mRNA decay activator protein zfp36 [Modicella reniformis]
MLKSTSTVLGDSTLRETGMDVGAAVVFSVNPPSPLESDVCADEQESILRNWHTVGTSADQSAGENSIEGYIKFEPEAMDHGIRAASLLMNTTLLNTSGRFGPSGQKSSDGPGAAANNSKGELYGKKGVGSSRRSGSGEAHRKSELYKTELYGDNCQFAHSAHELNHVTRHPRYKTQLCTSFQSQGYCKYNDRCTFIHHPEEARVSPLSTRRGSAPEKASWLSSSSTSSSGISVSVPEPKNERLRALSDSGLAYSENSNRAAKAREPVLTSVAPPPIFSQAQHTATATTINATNGVEAVPDAMFGIIDEVNPFPAPTMRRQRRMEINQPSDPISIAAGLGRYHQNVSGYSADLGYSTTPDVAPFSFTGMGLGLSITPTGAALPLPFRQDVSNPWRENAEADDDEQWAFKLAHYISTPQNGFRI